MKVTGCLSEIRHYIEQQGLILYNWAEQNFDEAQNDGWHRRVHGHTEHGVYQLKLGANTQRPLGDL